MKLDRALLKVTSSPTNSRTHLKDIDQNIPIRPCRTCIGTVRADSSLQLEGWLGSLLVWFGPTILQEIFQRNSFDEYRKCVTGHGIGLQIRLGPVHSQRWLALDFSLMSWTVVSRRISIQWNIGLPPIVSEDSDIFHYARASNVQAVKSILASRKGSPSDTTPNGRTLLHVRILDIAFSQHIQISDNRIDSFRG